MKSSLKNTHGNTTSQEGNASQSKRILSLDTFRGLTIAIMLLVNNIGHGSDTPQQLIHGGWHGITLADFVFPWFLFCVGIAIPLSVKSFTRRGLPSWRYDLKIIQRTIILVALGCLISSLADGRPEFAFGVLQIIGVSFLTGAFLYDLPLYRRAFIAGVMLVGYWAIIKYVPVPGVGVGHFTEYQNIIHHVNYKFLADLQMGQLPLLIPTSALVLISTIVGDILTHENFDQSKKAWLTAALGAGLVGLAVLWSISLPFNKPVWTPSYVLLTAGTAALALALSYWLIDMRGKRTLTFPLLVFGSNAILVYAAPILFKDLVLHPLHIHTGGPARVSIYIALWWIVLYILYRRKLFFKV